MASGSILLPLYGVCEGVKQEGGRQAVSERMAKGGGGENDSARMQLALRFNLSEAIAERNLNANANGVTCFLARP